MKKQLDTTGIMNELKVGSRFFSPSTPAPAVEKTSSPIQPSTTLATPQSTAQSTGASTPPSTGRPTNQPASESTQAAYDQSAILGRPKAFYITAQQDRDLDTAVQKLAQRAEGKVNQKIDRSTVMRLLLEQADLTHDAAIDKLYSQLVSRLIRQLSG